ncbi:MAG: putative arginyl-tRNA--protein transferase [Pseudohongiella sp.]|nr:MAG: putative arginyl-tRNA--protein transferase [Pseudohongiella sp.]
MLDGEQHYQMNSKSKIHETIRLFRTAPHPCSYKESETAATVFVDPELTIDRYLNSRLTELGYRRSGEHIYRPDCEHCQACISCRLPVRQFKRSKRLQRIWNRNKDLRVQICSELSRDDAYSLYQEYIEQRHSDGDMYPATPEQYDAFIRSNTEGGQYYCFYLEEKLVAVGVSDTLEDGLSAVYTFFDPKLEKRSLGNYVILWQIEQARSLGLSYLYLGYWIKDCPKMQYKSTFRPLEMLVEGSWVLVK